MYTCTCIHTCIHTSTYPSIHTCMHTYAHTHIHTHTYIHTYIHACMHAVTSTLPHMYTCIIINITLPISAGICTGLTWAHNPTSADPIWMEAKPRLSFRLIWVRLKRSRSTVNYGAIIPSDPPPSSRSPPPYVRCEETNTNKIRSRGGSRPVHVNRSGILIFLKLFRPATNSGVYIVPYLAVLVAGWSA